MKINKLPSILLTLLTLILSGGFYYFSQLEIEKQRQTTLTAWAKKDAELRLRQIKAVRAEGQSAQALLFQEGQAHLGQWMKAEVWERKQLRWLSKKARKKEESFELHPVVAEEAEAAWVVVWAEGIQGALGLDLLSLAFLRPLKEQVDQGEAQAALWLEGEGNPSWLKQRLLYLTPAASGPSYLLGIFNLKELLLHPQTQKSLDAQGLTLTLRIAQDLPASALTLYRAQADLWGQKLSLRYELRGQKSPLNLEPVPLAGALALLLFGFGTAFFTFKAAQIQANRNQELFKAAKLHQFFNRAISLSSKAKEMEGLVQSVLGEIAVYAGWEVAHAYLPNAENEANASEVWYFAKQAQSVLFKQHFESRNFSGSLTLTDRVINHQSYVWIPDISQDRQFTKSRAKLNIGANSAVGIPLFLQGEIVIVLEFFGSQVQECDEGLISEVLTVVDLLAGFVEAHWSRVRIGQTENRAKGALDNIMESVFLMNEQGKIILMNYAAETHFGYRFQDIRGMGFEMLLQEPNQSKFKHFFASYSKNPQGQTFDGSKELQGRKKDGSSIRLRLLLKELKIGNETNLLAIAVHLDKEEKQLSLSQKAELPLEPDDGAGTMLIEPKSSFGGKNLAITEPIRLIQEESRLLGAKAKTKKEASALRKIEVQAEALQDTLESLYILSRLQDGSLRPQKQPINLGQLLDRAMRRVAPRAYAKGLELVGYLQPDVPLEVLGDEALLFSLFLLLSDNAIRYTQTGEVSLELRCSLAEMRQAQLQLIVRDSGTGIDAGLAQELALQLRKEDSLIKREAKRLGLTLSYAKELSKRLNGKVSLSSQPGQWTQLQVDFTLEKALANKQRVTVEKSLSGVKIMVLDGNEVQGKMLLKKLIYRGAEAQYIGELGDAVNHLHNSLNLEQPFQLILLNLDEKKIMEGKLLAELEKLKEAKPKIMLLREGASRELESYPQDLLYRLDKPVLQPEPFQSLLEFLKGDLERG